MDLLHFGSRHGSCYECVDLALLWICLTETPSQPGLVLCGGLSGRCPGLSPTHQRSQEKSGASAEISAA